jgi:hypothetical protein
VAADDAPPPSGEVQLTADGEVNWFSQAENSWQPLKNQETVTASIGDEVQVRTGSARLSYPGPRGRETLVEASITVQICPPEAGLVRVYSERGRTPSDPGRIVLTIFEPDVRRWTGGAMTPLKNGETVELGSQLYVGTSAHAQLVYYGRVTADLLPDARMSVFDLRATHGPDATIGGDDHLAGS